MSHVDLATGFMRTGEIEIGPDQRRTPQRGEDAALLWWFTPDRPADSRSNPQRIRAVLSKPLGQGPDQVAVGIQAKNLKSRHAALDQPGPIIPERSLLRRIGHSRLPILASYIQKYIQNFACCELSPPKTKTEASLPPFFYAAIRVKPS